MVTVGTDIIEVDRIKRAIHRTKNFKNRVFTATEIKYCQQKAHPEQHFAGRFAAKEALKKAIMSMVPDISSIPFKTFEINNSENGKPTVTIINDKFSDLEQKYNLKVSISHIKSVATATAIMELI